MNSGIAFLITKAEKNPKKNKIKINQNKSKSKEDKKNQNQNIKITKRHSFFIFQEKILDFWRLFWVIHQDTNPLHQAFDTTTHHRHRATIQRLRHRHSNPHHLLIRHLRLAPAKCPS